MTLTFEHAGAKVDVRRELRTIGGKVLVPLFLIYLAVGLLVLRTGRLVLEHVSSMGARSFAAWSLSSALFFFAFFDYHTHGYLSPVFSLATVAVELSFLWLAYSFPTRPGSRFVYLAMIGVTGLGAIVAAWLIFAPPILHHDPVTARSIVGQAALPCLGAMAIATVVRWWRSNADTRRVLRSAVIGIGVVPALIGGGIALADTTGVDLVHAFLPLLGTLMPLSIGYALVRHNALQPRTVVKRAVFELPVFVFAVGVAGILWTQVSGPVGVLMGATVGGALWFVLTRWVGAKLFPARASFRPSIEALRDALSTCRTADDVSGALEQIIERWMPVTKARVTAIRDVDSTRFGVEALARVTRGEVHLRAEDGTLIVPLRALEQLHAIVTIERKHDQSPFNDEDAALVGTIAGFGALAMQHAHALDELERLRRVELDAAGREKQATVALLGAEVAHEVAYSLSYLRFLLRDGGTEISSGDVEVGRDEIARLERMLGAMRRLAPPPQQIVSTEILGPIRQAITLLREPMAQQGAEIHVEGDNVKALLDRDELVQVMANLLRNGLQAAPNKRIVVRCSAEESNVVIQVVDEGPGVPADLEGRLFMPWASGRPGGTGLGLAVAARIVRGWGGTLSYKRHDESTVFVVTTPRGVS